MEFFGVLSSADATTAAQVVLYQHGSQGVVISLSTNAELVIREAYLSLGKMSGTGSGFLVNNIAGYAAGLTTIAVDTGTGTLLVGDQLLFAGDATVYTVTSALAGGSVSFAPGLVSALVNNQALDVLPGDSVTGGVEVYFSVDGATTEDWRSIVREHVPRSRTSRNFGGRVGPKGMGVWVQAIPAGQVDLMIVGNIVGM